MAWLLIIGLIAAVVWLPGWWVRRVMARYSEPGDRYAEQGTGGELARHLLDRFELRDVGVERTEAGDHYDPEARTVRLSPGNHDGHSLTAVTVATHEVGHALQHAREEKMFGLRRRLVRASVAGERIGGIVLLAAPVAVLLTRAPSAGLALLVAGIATMGLATIVHLVTLPVEFDASRRALAALKQGGVFSPAELDGAEKVLRAAAWTYVAAAVSSLLTLLYFLIRSGILGGRRN